MFKFFKSTKNTNIVWQILNESYFKELDGKIGNTVLKIDESNLNGKSLLVSTNNENVRKILISNEAQILNDINKETGLLLTKINIV